MCYFSAVIPRLYVFHEFSNYKIRIRDVLSERTFFEKFSLSFFETPTHLHKIILETLQLYFLVCNWNSQYFLKRTRPYVTANIF
jgi:hypothetical protein